jgi:hypothetical protein
MRCRCRMGSANGRLAKGRSALHRRRHARRNEATARRVAHDRRIRDESFLAAVGPDPGWHPPCFAAKLEAPLELSFFAPRHRGHRARHCDAARRSRRTGAKLRQLLRLPQGLRMRRAGPGRGSSGNVLLHGLSEQLRLRCSLHLLQRRRGAVCFRTMHPREPLRSPMGYAVHHGQRLRPRLHLFGDDGLRPVRAAAGERAARSIRDRNDGAVQLDASARSAARLPEPVRRE